MTDPKHDATDRGPHLSRRGKCVKAIAAAQPRCRAIFLVGFMGAGKTTVARALARRLGCTAVDLDDIIVARAGRSVAEIFHESGEAAFRQAEGAALRDLLAAEKRRVIVALGGGAFVQEENARALKCSGVPVVFLDAPVEELRRRCAPRAAERPLFRDANQFRQLYEARRPAYMKADMRIETAGLTVEDVALEVARRLGLKPVNH